MKDEHDAIDHFIALLFFGAGLGVSLVCLFIGAGKLIKFAWGL